MAQRYPTTQALAFTGGIGVSPSFFCGIVVTFRFAVIHILRKDSLHISDENRELVGAIIAAQHASSL